MRTAWPRDSRLMRLLLLFPLALCACVFYVDLPLGEEVDGGADPADAHPSSDASDPPSWDTTSCATAAVCPPATATTVSVCGRVIDVADARVGLGNQPDVWCDPDAPTLSGACSIQIRFYPALPFATNPTGTPPLEPAEAGVDGCGRFYARDLPEPELGYMALAVDDAEGNSDSRVLTWTSLPAYRGDALSIDVYTMRHSLDFQWSQAAGLSGPTFSERGALLLLFGQPDMAAQVRITENGAVEPPNDFYFSDPDPQTRLMIDPTLPETGVNGAALKILSNLVNHSGTGNEPPDCAWESKLAASVPGTLHVGLRQCL